MTPIRNVIVILTLNFPLKLLDLLANYPFSYWHDFFNKRGQTINWYQPDTKYTRGGNMKNTVVKCIAVLAVAFSSTFAQAEDAEVQFSYDDVRSELVQADDLTDLLFELGAIDPIEEQLALSDEFAVTDELMSDESLEALARDGRRNRDGARNGNNRGRDNRRGHADRGRDNRRGHADRGRDHRRGHADRGRDHRRGHVDRGRRPQPPRYVTPRPPRRPAPPIRRRPPVRRYPAANYVCYAENARGETFRATGLFPRRVQQRAMNRCYDYSYRCYQLGCY